MAAAEGGRRIAATSLFSLAMEVCLCYSVYKILTA